MINVNCYETYYEVDFLDGTEVTFWGYGDDNYESTIELLNKLGVEYKVVDINK